MHDRWLPRWYIQLETDFFSQIVDTEVVEIVIEMNAASIAVAVL